MKARPAPFLAVTPAASPIADSAFRVMRRVEDAHWWFDGMETITARLLDRWLPPAEAPRRALDAGCGTGRNLRFLSERLGGPERVVGLDYSALALDCCVERGFSGRLTRGSVNALPFADAAFDLVTAFDVLVTQGVDDRAALREFARVLRPGGRLLLRVAAYDWLRGRHDLEWAVARRYSRRDLREKLAAAGFGDTRLSHANFWLLPVAVLKRFLERFRPPASESDLSLSAGSASLAGRLLRAVLASEAPLAARLPGGLPWGLSLFALARKPAGTPPADEAAISPSPGAV